jgi:hypothetical protein
MDILHQRTENLGNTPGLSHTSSGLLRRVAVKNFGDVPKPAILEMTP